MVPKTVSLESVSLDAKGSLSNKDLAGDAPKRMTYNERSAQDVGQSTGPAVMGAAQGIARQGVTHAKASLAEVQRYAQQNPYSVRAISFFIALALFVFSILGMINLFDAVFKPHQYLFALYNMLFAVIIIVADGNPDWFRKCWDVQDKLFTSAAFLTSQPGRAAFYFFVGSINLFMLPETFLWKLIYVCLGGALCFNGGLMLLDSAGCCCCTRRRQVDEPAFVGP